MTLQTLNPDVSLRLAETFAETRCAPARDLYELVSPGLTYRQWQRVLSRLRGEGVLGLLEPPPFGRARAVWHPLPSFRQNHKGVLTEHEVTVPTDEIAAYGWLRCRVRTDLRARGYRVESSYDAFRALSGHVLKKAKEELQKPLKALIARLMPRANIAGRQKVLKRRLLCALCERHFPEEVEHLHNGVTCRAIWRARPYLDYDVAWKPGESPVVILVDRPMKSIETRLNALPIGVPGQPRVEVLFRSYDDTTWSVDRGRFVARGPRRRRFESLCRNGTRAKPFETYLTENNSISSIHYRVA